MDAFMTTPADLTVTAAIQQLNQDEITAEELVRATLERMTATEPDIHAYARRFNAEALESAIQADTVALSKRGPLHGIPYAVKDTLNVAGSPTEANSPLLRDHVPVTDATVVRRLRDAGAILIGKHTTNEFALGMDRSPTRNPWDLCRFAGGSSCGSGASVAAGSSMLSIGTDAGGSTRMPAALTGVVGVKATYGRVSTYGTVTGAAVPGLEHVGIFTRSVADAELVFSVIAGPDHEDTRGLDFPGFVRPELHGSSILAGLRIGVLPAVRTKQPIQADVAAAFEAAQQVFTACGATLLAIPQRFDRAEAALALMVAVTASSSHLRNMRQKPEGFTAEVQRQVRAGLLIPAAHYRAAVAARTAIRAETEQIYSEGRLDLLIMPTLPRTAPTIAEFDPSTDMNPLTAFTLPWNLTGQPALSVPMGFDAEHLPIGLQLVGRPLDEATLFRAAVEFERATAWHSLWPRIGALQ